MRKTTTKGMDNRSILQAYIQTLSDKKCKEAYQILRERYDITRPKIIRLNAEAKPDGSGKVRLREKELERLLKTCGEYKFRWLVAKLHSYLDSLEERGECEAECKRRLKKYGTISHYHKLSKGWVAEAYAKEVVPTRRDKEFVDFYSISNEEEAFIYVNQLPPSLRINSPEVEYLMTRYPKLNGRFESTSEDYML